MGDYLEEHGATLLIGIIAVAALATQIPQIEQTINRNKTTAQFTQNRIQQNQTLEAENLAMQSSRKLANSRYDSGCEVVTVLKSQTVAAPIQEGQPIVAGAYAKQFDPAKPNPSHYLGRDMVVCDLYGTTAILRMDERLGYAVARSVAVTNDRDRMAKAQQSRPGLTRPNVSK